MARWIWMAGLLVVGLVGCDRLKGGSEATAGSEEEKGGARCRQACSVAYKACLEDCKNDSPQACESRCDMRQKKCTDACSGE